MAPMDWDVIVVGASFAGLAAATELAGAGRVLLIDKDEVGEGQTSACATPVAVLEQLQALETIEQVHDEIVIHLPNGKIQPYKPAYPYATFDYRRFCRLLQARSGAEFLRARAQGMAKGRVITSRGDFQATIMIDASGWRCVLGSSQRDNLAPLKARSIGLEARVPRQGEGLHFWIGDDRARDGYLWDFPAGDHSRVGLLRYRSGGQLKERLARFTEQPTAPEQIHGGVLPSRLRDAVVDQIFLVGDAAGHCLPLSGEGIRPALVYGQLAARLITHVLKGELTMPAALATYERAALRHRFKYQLLAGIERTLPLLPPWLMARLCWTFGAGPLAAASQTAYWRVAPAEALRSFP
jgi:flavin-dependent dehydrogenase